MIPIAVTILLSVWAGLGAERRWPERAGPASRRALTVALYALLPPVIFFNIARAELDANFAGGIALAWVALIASTALAWVAGTRLLRLTRPQVGAMMVCVLVANTSYLGFPLIAATLGFDAIGDAASYDVAVSGSALLVGAFSIGAAFGTTAGEGARQRLRAFFARNVPLYAGVLGLLAPDALAPDFAVDLSRVLIALILPLGFFAVGAALAEDAERGRLRLPPPLTRPVAIAGGLKIAVYPGLLLLLAAPLIALPDAYKLLAVMPAGLNSMIVVHAYGLDLRIAAGCVTWTTLVVVPIALVVSLL